jgi:pantoate--beta-alanine ligase
MFIFQKVTDLQQWLQMKRAEGQSIGFVPTMGALHQGHLDLVRQCNSACDLSVASVFVNPTQFNDPKDLEKYPRTPEQDVALLISVQSSALFMPPVEEVYPPDEDVSLHLDFGDLGSVMEGKFRPGHFAGMATVVNRLLQIVAPDRLFMGQKDFQQVAIVREMLRQTASDVQLVMCPTVRESDGLAMSSRNVRLSPAMRQTAPVIYQTLRWAKEQLPRLPIADITQEALKKLTAAGLKPEYFDIVDGVSLQPVIHQEDSRFIVACVAVFADAVRLIDNEVLKQV